ncbi:hypothetical protein D3C83_66660 [compost metagenome]
MDHPVVGPVRPVELERDKNVVAHDRQQPVQDSCQQPAWREYKATLIVHANHGIDNSITADAASASA